MLAQDDARKCWFGQLLLFFVYLFSMALPLTFHRKQRMRLVTARNNRTSPKHPSLTAPLLESVARLLYLACGTAVFVKHFEAVNAHTWHYRDCCGLLSAL
jgi:hypothetical protein